jgi:hypothetical protein
VAEVAEQTVQIRPAYGDRIGPPFTYQLVACVSDAREVVHLPANCRRRDFGEGNPDRSIQRRLPPTGRFH